jgi:hypothetical protein
MQISRVYDDTLRLPANCPWTSIEQCVFWFLSSSICIHFGFQASAQSSGAELQAETLQMEDLGAVPCATAALIEPSVNPRMIYLLIWRLQSHCWIMGWLQMQELSNTHNAVLLFIETKTVSVTMMWIANG